MSYSIVGNNRTPDFFLAWYEVCIDEDEDEYADIEGETVDEGPKMVTVNLVNAGAAKVNVIKVIKEITGLGLKESKDIADNGGAVKENISVDEANEIKAKLEEAGATVELA